MARDGCTGVAGFMHAIEIKPLLLLDIVAAGLLHRAAAAALAIAAFRSGERFADRAAHPAIGTGSGGHLFLAGSHNPVD